MKLKKYFFSLGENISIKSPHLALLILNFSHSQPVKKHFDCTCNKNSSNDKIPHLLISSWRNGTQDQDNIVCCHHRSQFSLFSFFLIIFLFLYPNTCTTTNEKRIKKSVRARKFSQNQLFPSSSDFSSHSN